MTVSIIIAVKTWQNNLEECINKCRELDFSDFEILILPDTTPKGLFPSSLNQSQNKGTVPIRIIPTGSVSPAYKRDLALSYAKGEILALLDDDAYPHQGWLKCALENFKDQDIAAVGGPAITPQGDNFKQRASGLVYSSSLASGKFTYRYLPKRRRYVDDYPSCNFLVRKSIMQELGGFKTSFWPGEDTKLCLDITHKLGKKIIYDPRVLVCHHRRPLFLPHLKQVASYALHRGYFVKKFPETSLRISYFLPSILLIGLFLGAVMSLFLIPIKIMFFLWIFLYIFLVLISSISRELRLIPYVSVGIILTHFIYGIYFLKGLLSRRLFEEK